MPTLRGKFYPPPPIIQDLLDEVEMSGRVERDILSEAGVSINTLANIRAGRRYPSLPTIIKVADALNLLPRLVSKEPSNGKKQP